MDAGHVACTHSTSTGVRHPYRPVRLSLAASVFHSPPSTIRHNPNPAHAFHVGWTLASPCARVTSCFERVETYCSPANYCTPSPASGIAYQRQIIGRTRKTWQVGSPPFVCAVTSAVSTDQQIKTTRLSSQRNSRCVGSDIAALRWAGLLACRTWATHPMVLDRQREVLCHY